MTTIIQDHAFLAELVETFDKAYASEGYAYPSGRAAGIRAIIPAITAREREDVLNDMAARDALLRGLVDLGKRIEAFANDPAPPQPAPASAEPDEAVLSEEERAAILAVSACRYCLDRHPAFRRLAQRLRIIAQRLAARRGT